MRPAAFALARALRVSETVEAYTVAVIFVGAAICYATPVIPWPVGVLIMPFLIQLPIYATGLLLGGGNHQRAASFVLMSLLLAGSVYFAMQSSWLRFVAWPVIGLFALNALVACLLSTRTASLGFAAIAPLLAVALWRTSPLAAIGVVALSHGFVLYPTLMPNCQWLGPVITRFETDRRELWLTIDDGLTDDTPQLLEMLDAHGVRATLFVKGTPAADEVLARGHTIANHSATHPSGTFWCIGPRALAREIDGGVRSHWFRAPVGMKNPFVHPALATRGMRLIGWTVRGFDATRGDCEAIAARIMPRLAPGAIVVMHQGREWSVRCIERVIVEAHARGYSFVIPDDAALRIS